MVVTTPTTPSRFDNNLHEEDEKLTNSLYRGGMSWEQANMVVLKQWAARYNLVVYLGKIEYDGKSSSLMLRRVN